MRKAHSEHITDGGTGPWEGDRGRSKVAPSTIEEDGEEIVFRCVLPDRSYKDGGKESKTEDFREVAPCGGV